MNTNEYQNLSIDDVVPFSKHPFKLYEGKRLDDMVESIKANGVITPIIVRPLDGKFEILSGHNRVEAAKRVGLTEVPAIVRVDLTDDEALLIVTETNLIQRSFTDLSHSERATALAAHHNATKQQGRRTDLIKEVEDLLETSGLLGGKLRERKEAGTIYDLSSRTVSRYVRVNELSDALKKRLDEGEFPLYAAVSLSFLRPREQTTIDKLLDKLTVNMRTAERLREMSADKMLNESDIKRVLAGDDRPVKVKPVKFSGKFLSAYFDEGMSAKEIEDIVAKALDKWFSETTE